MVETIFIPIRETLNSFLFSLRIFMGDIKRLKLEEEEESANYRSNLQPDNVARFKAKGKFIEQCILLGTSAEYLLKVILLKNYYIINDVRGGEKFDQILIDKIEKYNMGTQTQTELDAIFIMASENLGQPTNKTISLGRCIEIFRADIATDEQTYFSGLSNIEYNVTNPETRGFYGEIINLSNALEKIKDLRNNYVHCAETMYEERGIFKFLFNFLLFIAKKEFSDIMVELEFIS